MKKILFSTLFLSISITSIAQVGINTDDPKVTLDIVATADIARADALLVPRMTRAQLAAKDDAYVSAQNGAMIFITTIDGIATTKTMNVTTVGFYYYDSPTSMWRSVGGGVTLFRLNLGQVAATNYDWTNSNFDFWEFTSGTQLTLPIPSSYNGRTIYVRNQTGGTLQFSGTDGVGTPKGMSSITGIAAIQIYSNGTNWYLVSGRN
ncbi:hypothetical protein [Empedobacter brevis]|uniref:hypothetical protein n=1 Tax=Empedobacter brevis TaxID=247 RepID=UPI002FE128B4